MAGMFDRDPDHWCRLAAQVRAEAEQMAVNERKQLMFGIAIEYEKLAKAAEEANRFSGSSPQIQSVAQARAQKLRQVIGRYERVIEESGPEFAVVFAAEITACKAMLARIEQAIARAPSWPCEQGSLPNAHHSRN